MASGGDIHDARGQLEDFQSLAGEELLPFDQNPTASRNSQTHRPKKRLRFAIDEESSPFNSNEFQIGDRSSSSSSSEATYESESSKRRKLSNIGATVPRHEEFGSTVKQDWLLIICSYKRAETLCQKTLNYLNKTDVSFDNIRIIVGDASEQREYIKVLGENWNNRIIVGEIGLENVKNFASRYFPEGQELFFMDDDIFGLFRKGSDEDKKNMVMLLDLTAFVTKAFAETRRVGASLWGVYPVYNPFFMNMAPITYDLRFIAGPVYGLINSHSPDQMSTMADGQDFERTLKAYLRDGKVVRYNRVAARSNFNKGTGGMAVTRTPESMVAAKEKLVKLYPELCQLSYRWKKGQDRMNMGGVKGVRAELSLRDRRGVGAKKERATTLKEVTAKEKRGTARGKKDWGTSNRVLRSKTRPEETEVSDVITNSSIGHDEGLPLFSQRKTVRVIIRKTSHSTRDGWESADTDDMAGENQHCPSLVQMNTVRVTVPETPKKYRPYGESKEGFREDRWSRDDIEKVLEEVFPVSDQENIVSDGVSGGVGSRSKARFEDDSDDRPWLKPNPWLAPPVLSASGKEYLFDFEVERMGGDEEVDSEEGDSDEELEEDIGDYDFEEDIGGPIDDEMGEVVEPETVTWDVAPPTTQLEGSWKRWSSSCIAF